MFWENRFGVLKTQGFRAFLVNKYRNLRYQLLRMLFYNKKDNQEWVKLKGRFKGKRVFLIGNGPSLNKTPLYLLKDEYTMCFNHFGIMKERLNWNPYFYMSTDYLVLADISKNINSILNQCQYAFFPKVHYEGKRIYKIINKTNKILWLKPLKGLGFSLKMPGTFGGGTVIYSGLQVLQYLGFDEIILLGIDMNYKIHKTASTLNTYSAEVKSMNNDDPNHFDPRYFGKGKSYHQPKQFIIDNIMKSLNYVGSNQTLLGTNIINAGYDSNVECFPRKDFMSLFDYSQNDIENIFNELLSTHSNYRSVNEFVKRAKRFEGNSDMSEYKTLDFYCTLEIALKIYKEIIFTHVPFGPYENRYFFIKRDN